MDDYPIWSAVNVINSNFDKGRNDISTAGKEQNGFPFKLLNVAIPTVSGPVCDSSISKKDFRKNRILAASAANQDAKICGMSSSFDGVDLCISISFGSQSKESAATSSTGKSRSDHSASSV